MTAMPESRVFQLCRNLLDAGCDAPLIERFLALEQAGEREEQRRLLARHKVALLEKLLQDRLPRPPALCPAKRRNQKWRFLI